jgi:hypothetical protein
MKFVDIVADQGDDIRRPAVGPRSAEGELELILDGVRGEHADVAQKDLHFELRKPAPHDGQEAQDDKNGRRQQRN